MVTEASLTYFDHIPGANALYFVTRLPHTYKEADLAISEAIQRNYIKALGLTEEIFVTSQPPSLSQINLPDTT